MAGKPGVKFALAFVFLILLIGGAAGASLVISSSQIRQSQRNWCSTMDLLTSKPVSKPPDPKANPSRQNQYILYIDFVKLKKELGC